MVGGERLRRHDHFVEVALHQLCDHVAARRLAVKEENTPPTWTRVATGRSRFTNAAHMKYSAAAGFRDGYSS